MDLKLKWISRGVCSTYKYWSSNLILYPSVLYFLGEESQNMSHIMQFNHEDKKENQCDYCGRKVRKLQICSHKI